LVVPKVDVSKWTLTIDGMVTRKRVYTYDDLLAMNLIEQDITLTCVSNEVGGILMGNARWLGIPLAELLADAGADPEASQIIGRSVDGWTAGFPTAALKRSRAMVAVGMNGEPLPFQHGFPARLVVPGIYGYASATKWLDKIELTTLDAADGYWVPRGYSKEAPIKMGSRIDVPRGLSTIAAGKSAIAGIAWSQTIGIGRVEVKVDNGPWQEATLAAEVDIDTWRQWKFEWDATTGQHEITVRAFDAAGKLQTEERVAPLPNGATGWHQVVVFVS
jgi:DMSO/TMAO reductase YedYZ molybdopterin-dependent catalytic subunit